MPTSTASEPRSAPGVTKAETLTPFDGDADDVAAAVLACAELVGLAEASSVAPAEGLGAWTVTELAPSASVMAVPSGKRLSKEEEACSMRQLPLTRSAPACAGVREMIEPRPPATLRSVRTRDSTVSRASTAPVESMGTRCEAQVS